MFWTYCTLSVCGRQADVDEFENKNGLPGSPFSLSALVPVTILPTDEILLDAWGCSSTAEIIQSWKRATPTWGFVRFRTTGGPPTRWLRRAVARCQGCSMALIHVTEATALFGRMSYAKNIWTTSEVEGDTIAVEKELSTYRI